MDSLIQDFRVSARSLLRHRGFTLVAVLTLALGIGATTAIFSVVRGVLLEPLPYPDSTRIVSIWQTDRRQPGPNEDGSVSHVNFLDWKGEARSFESMALYSRATTILTLDGESEVAPGAVVTPGFFRVFKASLTLGRDFTGDEDVPGGPNVVIISQGLWKERFGGRPDILGQVVEISARPRRIVGVAPDGFDFPGHARLWMPVKNDDGQCGRDCVYLNGVGRLRAGVSLATARDEMKGIASSLEKTYPRENTNVTSGMSTLQEDMVGNVRLALLVILGAVFAVLLIACANVGNLLLVRGAAREGEVGVRAALGGSRARIVRYLLTESALLSGGAAIIGLLLATWGVELLKAVAPADIPRLSSVSIDAKTFLFALGLTTVSALVFGLIPALRLSGVPLTAIMTGRGTQGDRRGRLGRGGLVAVEVALSVLLLLGAGLLVRSLVALQQVDPGFQFADRTIFTIGLPQARYPTQDAVTQAGEALTERVAALPGVDAVARISGLPLGTSVNVQSFSRPDKPEPAPGQTPNVLYRGVDAAYFRAMGIPVMSGRGFTRDDRAGSPLVVVISNRTAQRFWPGENPVGKSMKIGVDGDEGRPRTIVGVVADVRSTAIALAPEPEIYVPLTQSALRTFTFVVKSRLAAASILPATRDAVRSFDQRLPLIRPGSLATVVEEQLERPRFYFLLLAAFAALAIVLAMVGVYGLVAYGVSRRTREIGLRMALGADGARVTGLFTFEGLRPAAIGVAAGSAVALAAGQAMRSLLYQVGPYDVPTFVGVIGVTLVVVTLASLVPARRAARIPPSEALRAE